MTEHSTYVRGDVVLIRAPFPSSPAVSKVRPAVVVQNDTGNRFSSNLILASISSQLPTRPYPTNLLLPLGSDLAEGSGLQRDSVVEAETLITLSKKFVQNRVGRFGPDTMRGVDACLRVSLGL